MYKIQFNYPGNLTETYGGGSYTFQEEKYAVLSNSNPKLYKTKAIAERSAQRLINGLCVNVSPNYEIVEV